MFKYKRYSALLVWLTEYTICGISVCFPWPFLLRLTEDQHRRESHSHERGEMCTEMFLKQFSEKQGPFFILKIPYLHFPFLLSHSPSPRYNTFSPPLSLSTCSWENSLGAFRRALTLRSRSISLVSWHRTPPTTRWREGEDRTEKKREHGRHRERDLERRRGGGPKISKS